MRKIFVSSEHHRISRFTDHISQRVCLQAHVHTYTYAYRRMDYDTPDKTTNTDKSVRLLFSLTTVCRQ